MKISVKILATFLIIALLAAIVGVYSIVTLSKTTDESKDLFSNDGMSQGYLGYVYAQAQYGRALIRDAILQTDKQLVQNDADKLAQSKKMLLENLALYGETRNIDSEKKNFDTLSQKIATLNERVEQIMSLAQTDNAGAKALLNDDSSAQMVKDAFDAIESEVKANIDSGMAGLAAQSTQEQTSLVMLIVLVAAAVVLAITLGIIISRSISRSITKVARAADKLAAGNTDVDLKIKSKDETGQLAQSFGKMVGSIKALMRDVDMLSTSAINGEYETRADASKHVGDYKKIVEGVNNTLDTMADKVFWYENLLDAIPLPLSVTDMDMNWTFINKPVENMLNVKRAEVLGKQCENWNAAICRTEKCGIARLKSGQLRTEFDQFGGNYQVDTSYIQNRNGDKIGHIEVVQDITERVKISEYTNEEVKKLAHNLDQMALGNLQLSFEVAESDKYTEATKKTFQAINNSFKLSIDSISGYISEISRVLGEMSTGNMTQEVNMEFAGDFAQIKESINTIASSLNTILKEINRAAEQVAAGTRQVSDGSQTLSQGATEQAASIEELTSTVTEIAAQTRQNAANAAQANELAVAASSSASKGNGQMKNMLSSMGEINESSSSISKIIKVIDDIAFQTNILALNAAVEAARAGAYGKGFAVVAEEVRNLAAKSAEAAKETTNLIEGSIKKVEQGTKYANDTAGALGEILENSERVATLVAEIAVASNEQATGIAQVNKGIEQVATVVQGNSATAEESAAASEELSSQAELLKGMVGQFKLSGNEYGKEALMKETAKPKVPAKAGITGEFGKY